jgi:hypothetical protein
MPSHPPVQLNPPNSVLLALNEENGVIVKPCRIFEMEPSTVWTLQLETLNFGNGMYLQNIAF